MRLNREDIEQALPIIEQITRGLPVQMRVVTFLHEGTTTHNWYRTSPVHFRLTHRDIERWRPERTVRAPFYPSEDERKCANRWLQTLGVLRHFAKGGRVTVRSNKHAPWVESDVLIGNPTNWRIVK